MADKNSKKRKTLEWERLGAREREILEILLARGEATAAQVREDLASPPTYSAVRGMLALLEQKGYVSHRRDGVRYVYAAHVHTAAARGSAVRKLLDTFFGGSPARAVATLLELPDDATTDVSLAELRRAILAARNEGR